MCLLGGWGPAATFLHHAVCCIGGFMESFAIHVADFGHQTAQCGGGEQIPGLEFVFFSIDIAGVLRGGLVWHERVCWLEVR